MKTTFNTLSVLAVCAVANGQEVIMDNIGDNDGSGVGGSLTASQDFDAGFDAYDIVTADDFTGDGANISMVEIVLGGWNGWIDPSYVTAYTANLYSTPDAAGASLTGDIASQLVDVADVASNGDWMGGATFLMEIPTSMASGVGANWAGVLPENEFGVNGQTGIADSVGGNGFAIQANPNGGFGFGPWQEVAAAAAYRVTGGAAADPCTLPLPDLCNADVDGDGQVAVGDVLAVIGSWGEMGDGTFRPVGDCAPMPLGDCTVNVADVLEVIGQWGADCAVYGGCCYGDGTCSVASSDACAADGGTYFGDNTDCSAGTCASGACCIADACTENSVDACNALGGSYLGDGSTCAKVSCDVSCKAVGCQSPDQTGHGTGGIVGATSDMNASAGYRVADTFNPTSSGTVSNVCWWGIYIDFGANADCGAAGPGTGDNFTIEYYLDDGDGLTPGALHAGPFSVASNVAPSGNVIPSGIGDLIEYEYTAAHPAVDVVAGMCYWISIYNETTESCFWLWETAPPGDERSAQYNNAEWGSADYDVAFCVDIDTVDVACGAYTGPCCVAGACSITTILECDTLEGEFGGYNLTCEDVNNCNEVPGACCIDADTCIDDLTESECGAFGGTFMGDGTECTVVDCDIQPNPYDQIGASNGQDLTGNITASQFFEDAFAAYDIATLDNFVFDSETTISTIEAVLNGWNGYVDSSGITNYTISVYSSPTAAGADLIGDVYSIDIVTADYPSWSGAGELVMFTLDLTLPAGDYWYAIIPWNEFGTNGQTGIMGSNLGDGEAYQANPNDGFGFGGLQPVAGNAAYRLTPSTP